MTEILDQTDLTDRAARLVEAARKAGADAADAVCVRGISLSVEVRLGKIEETAARRRRRLHAPRLRRQALRHGVGERPHRSGRARRAGRCHGQGRARGSLMPASPIRRGLPGTFPTRPPRRVDPLGGRADRIGARRRGCRPRRPRRHQFRRRLAPAGRSAAGARHLARLCRLLSHLPLRPLGLGDRRRGDRHGARLRRRDARSTAPISPTPAAIGRKAGERAVRRLNPQKVADRPRHGRLRPAGRHEPGRPSRRRDQRRGDRAQDQLPQATSSAAASSPRRSRSTTIRRARAASPRIPSTAKAWPPAAPDHQGRRPEDLVPRFGDAPASSASPPTAAPPAAAAILRPARPT